MPSPTTANFQSLNGFFVTQRPTTAEPNRSKTTQAPLTAHSSSHSSPHSSHHRRSFSRSSADSALNKPGIRRSISLRAPFRGRQHIPASAPDDAPLAIIASNSSAGQVRSHTDLPTPLQRAPTFDGFRTLHLRRAVTEQANMSYGNGSLGPPAQINPGGGSHAPVSVTQHILDTASKRIQTLDYLRKTHESRIYWFNTLSFTRPDLLKLPSYSPTRLGRRAQNFLLLGFSLPVLTDLHAQTSAEYLKALNSLFSEFDTYQSMHPPDGSGTSSLSRARIPQIFKRSGAAKGRRLTETTTAAGSLDGGASAGGGGSATNLSSIPSSSSLAGSAASHIPSTFSPPAEPLLPTEHYTQLLTPPLPFEPDFFETFATLCDVLIDSYARITQLVSEGAENVGNPSGEMFAKADSKIKKVIVSGMMREFEERTREGMKGEIAGIGKVVLGGLM